MSDARAHFVEQFALRLSEAGMQRMPARVFAALMIGPRDGLTAREIGDVLQISTGAVSGATRYLAQTGLAERRRIPGERSDRFDVRGTTWAEAMLLRSDMIHTLSSALGTGLAATKDPDAQERLRDTRDFFDFLAAELPALVERWRGMRDSQA